MHFVKKVKELFTKVKLKIQEIRERREARKARKPQLVNWIFHNLDDCVLTAYVQDQELVVKISPKMVAAYE